MSSSSTSSRCLLNEADGWEAVNCLIVAAVAVVVVVVVVEAEEAASGGEERILVDTDEFAIEAEEEGEKAGAGVGAARDEEDGEELAEMAER